MTISIKMFTIVDEGEYQCQVIGNRESLSNTTTLRAFGKYFCLLILYEFCKPIHLIRRCTVVRYTIKRPRQVNKSSLLRRQCNKKKR